MMKKVLKSVLALFFSVVFLSSQCWALGLEAGAVSLNPKKIRKVLESTVRNSDMSMLMAQAAELTDSPYQRTQLSKQDVLNFIDSLSDDEIKNLAEIASQDDPINAFEASHLGTLDSEQDSYSQSRDDDNQNDDKDDSWQDSITEAIIALLLFCALDVLTGGDCFGLL